MVCCAVLSFVLSSCCGALDRMLFKSVFFSPDVALNERTSPRGCVGAPRRSAPNRLSRVLSILRILARISR